MSQAQISTPLKGWDGPFFPSQIAILNKMFAQSGFNPPIITDVLKRVRYFQLKNIISGDMRKSDPHIVTTDDGYKWLGGLRFECKRGEVMVILPRMNDTLGKDGVPLDRAVTFYTKGHANYQEVGNLFGQLSRLWHQIILSPRKPILVSGR